MALPVIHNMVRGDQGTYQTPLEKKIVLLANAGVLWDVLFEWFQMEEWPAPEGISETILTVIERNKKGRSSP